jgi:hypothetical protein
MTEPTFLWPFWLSLAGCAIGAGMGAYAMLKPSWAAWLVRLRDDPARPGGSAEFRGTYGGLFFAVHAGAAYFIWTVMDMLSLGDPMALQLGLFTLVPAAALAALVWWGTAVGRVISILADKNGGAFNYGSVVFELILGALIAAPLLAFLGHAPVPAG